MTDAHGKSDSRPDDRSRLDKALHRVFAGPGSGQPCAHCRGLITATEVEYEVVEAMDAQPTNAEQATRRFHLQCYQLWRNTNER